MLILYLISPTTTNCNNDKNTPMALQNPNNKHVYVHIVGRVPADGPAPADDKISAGKGKMLFQNYIGKEPALERLKYVGFVTLYVWVAKTLSRWNWTIRLPWVTNVISFADLVSHLCHHTNSKFLNRIIWCNSTREPATFCDTTLPVCNTHMEK